MKQNLEDLFAVLDNADEETVRYMAEHFLFADKPETEEVFAMSEKKYQAGNNFTDPAEEETYEVQITRSTGLYKSVIAAVACLAVTVGAVGAVANMKRVQPEPELSAAEAVETEAVTEIQTEAQSSETVRKSAETTSIPKKETVMTSVPETLPAVAEIVMTSVPETVPEIVTTTVQTVTETILTETVPEEISVPEPETQYIPEIIETQPLPETEAVTEETQPAETLILASGTYYLTEANYDYVPGFVAKSYEGPEMESGGETFRPMYDVLYPVLNGTESNDFDVEYAPTYIPEGYYPSRWHMAESPRKCRSLSYALYPDSLVGGTEVFAQFTKPSYRKTLFSRQTIGNTSDLVPLNTIEINGHAGWAEYTSGLGCYIVTWDNGDYIMSIQAYDLSLEEIIKMAESVQPMAESPEYAK